jgi:hypothetical protein
VLDLHARVHEDLAAGGLGIAAEFLGAPIATALMAGCGLLALAVTHRYWKHISGG